MEKKVSLRFDMPEAEHRELKVMLAERGGNFRELLRRLVREELASAKDRPVPTGSTQK